MRLRKFMSAAKSTEKRDTSRRDAEVRRQRREIERQMQAEEERVKRKRERSRSRTGKLSSRDFWASPHRQAFLIFRIPQMKNGAVEVKSIRRRKILLSHRLLKSKLRSAVMTKQKRRNNRKGNFLLSQIFIKRHLHNKERVDKYSIH